MVNFDEQSEKHFIYKQYYMFCIEISGFEYKLLCYNIPWMTYPVNRAKFWGRLTSLNNISPVTPSIFLPAIQFKNDDFPEPDGPITATNSPGLTQPFKSLRIDFDCTSYDKFFHDT